MFAQKNNGRVLLKLGLVLVILAGLGVAAFFSLRGAARVAIVKRELAEDAVTGSVIIDADGGIRELKSQAEGRVIDVHKIKPGSSFKKGDPLVLLDKTDLERAKREHERKYNTERERTVMQAKIITDVEDATRALEYAKRLLEHSEVTAEHVRTAEKALNAAKTAKELREFNLKTAKENFDAEQEEMKLQIEKMTIRAPSDGEIHEAIAWEGALIGAGSPVAQFISNDRVVAARISEENFGRLKVGQPAKLRLLTYGSETYPATISELFPVADDAQRFKVFLKVEVEPDRLKPRSTGEVTITLDQHENALTIPPRALFNGDQVFVVKNGVVEQRKVEVGFRALNKMEIRNGLQDGDHVIVENLELYRTGKRVTVEVANGPADGR